MELTVVYTLAVSVVELDDLGWGNQKKREDGGMMEYPSGLGDLDDGELSAIKTLHLHVELFVADDEDDVYWERDVV